MRPAEETELLQTSFYTSHRSDHHKRRILCLYDRRSLEKYHVLLALQEVASGVTGRWAVR